MDKPLNEIKRHLVMARDRQMSLGFNGKKETLALEALAQLESALAEKEKEIAELRECCSMRGARMQILRDYIPCTVWHQDVLYERPEAADWFDADGVPK